MTANELVLTRADEPLLTMDFCRKTLLKRRVAVFMAATMFLSGCFVALFPLIGYISMALGLLNSMGVFGDGKLSQMIGIISMVGSMVAMAGSLMAPGVGIGTDPTSGSLYCGAERLPTTQALAPGNNVLTSASHTHTIPGEAIQPGQQYSSLSEAQGAARAAQNTTITHTNYSYQGANTIQAPTTVYNPSPGGTGSWTYNPATAGGSGAYLTSNVPVRPNYMNAMMFGASGAMSAATMGNQPRK